MLDRGDAIGVGDGGVGSGVEKNLNDVSVGLGAVAEEHGFHEGGPAEVVDVVDVDIGADDTSDVVDVPAFARWYQ